MVVMLYDFSIAMARGVCHGTAVKRVVKSKVEVI